MSGSRFVLKQIHVRGAGTSDLTRYVAKSKLDAAREGRKPRELFTQTADNLTYLTAREWLSITGGVLEKRDVLHYVLSFEEGREYEVLGDDEDERKSQTVAFIRRALAESLREVGVAEMRWVAGIHRNTDNPHVHLLLNKNALARGTQDVVRLPKLPAPVIAHYARALDGSREFSYGLLINSFAEQVDARHRARVRALQFENSIRTVQIARNLLAPDTLRARRPTEDEQLVGRWLVAEIEAARAPQTLALRGQMRAETAARLGALRDRVARLDNAALAQSQPVVSAFIETEQLRSFLTAAQRGLTLHKDELPLRFERVRQVDTRSQPERGAQAHQHEPNSKTIIPTPDTKEQSRIIPPPIRTR